MSFKIQRKSDEIHISHAIRYGRYTSIDSVSEASRHLFGVYRRRTLIPWEKSVIPKILDNNDLRKDIQVTDLPLLLNISGTSNFDLNSDIDIKSPGYLKHAISCSHDISVLQFCSACVQIDVNKYGHSWWRIGHNLPGILCCPVHKLALREVTWDLVTSDSGYFPEEFMSNVINKLDNEISINLCNYITELHQRNTCYCPLIIATATCETIRCAYDCHSLDEIIYFTMERFDYLFPESIQKRINVSQKKPLDVQIIELIRDGNVRSPLAVMIVAIIGFQTLTGLNAAYRKNLQQRNDFLKNDFCEDRFDKAMSIYPHLYRKFAYQ